MGVNGTIDFRAAATSRIIGYLPGCYPDEDLFRRAAGILVDAGISCVEIGIPGSVPPLEGATLTGALSAVERRYPDLGIVLERATRIAVEEGLEPISMAFRGAVFETIGLKRFLRTAAGSGARAVLVPDATADERRAIESAASTSGLGFVRFLAAGDGVVDAGQAPGSVPLFAYVQTAAVPTGGSFTPSPDLTGRIERARIVEGTDSEGTVPVALGFGIRTPDQVKRALSLGADLVVVGTAMVDALDEGLDAFFSFVRSIAATGRNQT